jgi:hypothetical protein
VRALIFDPTALVALGRGTPKLSGYVVTARDDPDALRLYAPALCLTAGESEKAGLAYHVAGLPFEIIDLGFEDARQVGAAVATGVDWRLAHALVAGRPSLDWPRGRIVVTAQPDAYKPWDITTTGWENPD